jgi:hypothetical protein
MPFIVKSAVSCGTTQGSAFTQLAAEGKAKHPDDNRPETSHPADRNKERYPSGWRNASRNETRSKTLAAMTNRRIGNDESLTITAKAQVEIKKANAIV